MAQACSISTTWYTWIEQGREVSLPASALARVADGLRMTAAERAFLFELARRRDPSPGAKVADASLLRFVFFAPAARDFIGDRDDRPRRIVAEFRADTAHQPYDVSLPELARGMQRESVAFAQMWDSYAVLAHEGGLRQFNHPEAGALQLRQVTLIPPMHPGHKLVVLLSA